MHYRLVPVTMEIQRTVNTGNSLMRALQACELPPLLTATTWCNKKPMLQKDAAANKRLCLHSCNLFLQQRNYLRF